MEKDKQQKFVNQSQQQLQQQFLSQTQMFATKFHLSTVILYTKRILSMQYPNNQLFQREELLGQELFYLPKSLKHESLSLIDACDSFRELAINHQMIKGGEIDQAFEKLKKMFDKYNDPFIKQCFRLITLALNGSDNKQMEEFYADLYKKTEIKYGQDTNPTNTIKQEQVNNTVQMMLNKKYEALERLKNLNSQESQWLIKESEILFQSDQNNENSGQKSGQSTKYDKDHRTQAYGASQDVYYDRNQKNYEKRNYY